MGCSIVRVEILALNGTSAKRRPRRDEVYRAVDKSF